MDRKSYRDAKVHCEWAEANGYTSLEVIEAVLQRPSMLAGWDFAEKVVARASQGLRDG